MNRWKPNKYESIIIWLRMLPKRWKLLFGFCPSCNSDAPKVDSCPICEGYSTSNGDQFPPSKATKEEWLKREHSAIFCGYMIRSMVSENRKARKRKVII